MIDCVMLVDDSKDDIFFHSRVLKKSGLVKDIIAMENAEEALEYLRQLPFTKNKKPTLIFLDVHMPGMDGWLFLSEYGKLPEEVHSKIVLLLTSIEDPQELTNPEKKYVDFFKTKPITLDMIKSIVLETESLA